MSNFWKIDEFDKQPALIEDSGDSVTYKELQGISNQLGNILSDNRKRLLFVMAQNNIESIMGYIAALNSNTAVLLIDVGIDKELFDNLANTYRPDFIWGPEYKVGEGDYKYKNYSLVKNDIDRDFNINEELALLLSTSGSTGSPKLVRLSYKNLQANAKSIAEYLELDKSERPITTLPLSYTYGLSIINSHFEVGAPVLLSDNSVMQKSFWNFFKSEKATSIAGVPYTYKMLDRLNIYEMKLPTLRYMTQAGGKLNAELAEKLAFFADENQLKFYIMYGQTEATARMSYLSPEYSLEKYKSIGNAIPGGKFMVVDEDSSKIEKPYTKGELVYRGKNVMMGYAYKESDLGKGDQLGNKLETGDIAYFDEEGFYYIAGRKKRFIKVFGKRVNLDQIESHLKGQGYNVACGGKDNLILIAACDDVEGIKELLRKKYQFHPSVIKVIEVDEIIRNESGKIMYKELFKGVLD